MKGITIRPGRIEDVETVRSFTEDTFTWGDYVGREFPTWLDRPDELAIVAADDNDSPVAVARVGLLSEAEAWLSGARVHPDHRRQGIGSVMNDFGVEWARERGRQGDSTRHRRGEHGGPQPGRKARLSAGRPIRPGGSSTHRSRGPPAGAGTGSNGGRRLTGTERLDLAPSAEADPAYLVWSTGDQARVGHQLFAADGWSFRRLRPADLVAAAKARRLWTSPSAWVVTEEDGRRDVGSAFRHDDRGRRPGRDCAGRPGPGTSAPTTCRVMIPRVDWLEEALERHRFQMTHPNSDLREGSAESVGRAQVAVRPLSAQQDHCDHPCREHDREIGFLGRLAENPRSVDSPRPAGLRSEAPATRPPVRSF